MVGMVGLIKDAKYVIPSRVQHAGDKLYLVGKTGDDYAGSELQKMMTGEIAGTLADFDLEHVHDYLSRLLQAEQSGLVASAHDLSEGGLAVAAAETVFKTELGLNADFRDLDKKQFFSETPGRMLVSVAPENVAAFEEIMQDDAMPAGEVAATQWLEIHLADAELNLPVAQMQKLWEEALPCAMKSKD